MMQDGEVTVGYGGRWRQGRQRRRLQGEERESTERHASVGVERRGAVQQCTCKPEYLVQDSTRVKEPSSDRRAGVKMVDITVITGRIGEEGLSVD
jgi:hypothetical protein